MNQQEGLIEFKELPDESTPASVPNMNHNFKYLNDKIDDNQDDTNAALANKIDKSKGIELYNAWALPTELDDLPTGVYMASSVQGAPTTYASMFICLAYSSSRKVQICIQMGNPLVWVRGISGGSWTNWGQL